MSNIKALIDSNILIYASDEDSIFHLKAKKFLERNVPQGNFCLTLQNITELYAIVTNRKITPRALSQIEATRLIKSLLHSQLFEILFPKPTTPQTILNLLRKYKIKTQEIHDLHLAAVMIDNKVSTVYSADTKIFTLVGLTVINPLK